MARSVGTALYVLLSVATGEDDAATCVPAALVYSGLRRFARRKVTAYFLPFLPVERYARYGEWDAKW